MLSCGKFYGASATSGATVMVAPVGLHWLCTKNDSSLPEGGTNEFNWGRCTTEAVGSGSMLISSQTRPGRMANGIG